jgi:hypothetical protein
MRRPNPDSSRILFEVPFALKRAIVEFATVKGMTVNELCTRSLKRYMGDEGGRDAKKERVEAR